MANIRDRIGSNILNRRRKKTSRQVRVHNFDTAGSAVVLFDSREEDAFPAVKELCKFLKNKKIRYQTFGYATQKELPQEMLFTSDFAFIKRGDMNWYRKPAWEAVDLFLAAEPDLLFDFSTGKQLELCFLVLWSNAEFKVGCFSEEARDYDLMIDLGKSRDMSFLAEQFIRYIEMLNPVNEK